MTGDDHRHQRAGHQPQRHFEIAIEQLGRRKADEHAAGSTTDRKHQVEAREVARCRFGCGQLAMAKHAGQEQAGAIERYRVVNFEHTALGGEAPGHEAKRHQRGPKPQLADVTTAPATTLEYQHKGQQVERERQHPEKGNRRDVLRNVVRDRQQHQRGECAKGKPEGVVAGGGRCLDHWHLDGRNRRRGLNQACRDICRRWFCIRRCRQNRWCKRLFGQRCRKARCHQGLWRCPPGAQRTANAQQHEKPVADAPPHRLHARRYPHLDGKGVGQQTDERAKIGERKKTVNALRRHRVSMLAREPRLN